MPKWSSIDFNESKDDMKTDQKLIMEVTEDGNYKFIPLQHVLLLIWRKLLILIQ